MARCSVCGTEVIMIRTKGGRDMPADTRKVYFTLGGQETFITKEGEVLKGTRTALRARPAKTGYVPHYAVCPGKKTEEAE